VVGARVEFRPGPSGGAVTNSVAHTDGSGIANAGEWTVSARTGAASCVVSINGILFAFTALIKPDVPVRFDEIRTAIVGFSGEQIDRPPLRLTDKFGNPTPGIAVALAIGAGNGALGTSTAVTDNNGRIPSIHWRLGSSPGENTIIASVNGMAPVTFHAQGLDRAALDWYDLEKITIGSNELYPADEGISRAKFGLTRFDRCLCTNGTGYFITEIEYGDTRMNPFGGAYRIDGASLHLLGAPEPQITSLSDPEFFLLEQSMLLGGSRIEIEITRWYPDWWEMGTEVWVYQPTANGGAQK
jgi:hypothetical protein